MERRKSIGDRTEPLETPLLTGEEGRSRSINKYKICSRQQREAENSKEGCLISKDLWHILSNVLCMSRAMTGFSRIPKTEGLEGGHGDHQ